MPKRSLDVANMGGPNAKPAPARKTERSHEENQERAYIAASRRADRSIEARVQSAKMASEIHKKRTGKAFRITEEIVMKEEMYEEEDDDFPRSYRLLKSNMQTSSAELNARVDAYLTNRVAMSQLLSATETDWRNNEINQTFAQFFPQAQRQAQSMSHRWSTPGYPVPQPQGSHVTSPMEQQFDPNFQAVNYAQRPNRHDERSHSMSGLSPTDSRNDAPLSPPALTPGSGSHPQTPQSRCASTFTNVQPPPMMDFNHESSAFTTELPAEAKMLLGGVGLNDTFSPAMYGEQQNWGAQQSFGYGDEPKYFKDEDAELGATGEKYPDVLDTMNWGTGDFNTPTKHYTEEPSWDSFLNDGVWSTEQQQ
ncbi:hypothetical protein NW752_008816 [Fusarium irregulare]|uniref:Uncharacterized protein n=1 Tax=Fusarium irregulare TaxID=2494466 RepID=A0A9W8PJD2_9HYPO|nr:hypothetical protein LB507_002928 [Fusarium sp. FIESC RH6]KAJ4008861.1 hypothetical protein NW766_009043 [Fusarium irregulare]KAJ4010688.1 hypothetical protein NW752_008816 [Fusarium irregulare]